MKYNFRSGVQYEYKHTLILGTIGLIIIGVFIGAGISSLLHRSTASENTTITRVTKAPTQENAAPSVPSTTEAAAPSSQAVPTTTSTRLSFASSRKSPPISSSNTTQSPSSSDTQPSSPTPLPVGGRGGEDSDPDSGESSVPCSCNSVMDTVDTIVNIADNTTTNLTNALGL